MLMLSSSFGACEFGSWRLHDLIESVLSHMPNVRVSQANSHMKLIVIKRKNLISCPLRTPILFNVTCPLI